MRSLLAPLVLALAGAPFLLSALRLDRPTADEAGVRAAVEDYVLGFYEAAPERIRRSVSRDLVKVGYWRRDEEPAYQAASTMTFDQALELAGKWNQDGRQGKDLPYEIRVLDVLDKTAAAMLKAKWGYDYFHLVKEEDRWRIHQVLWQSQPPEEG